jgi:hypothetical protein
MEKSAEQNRHLIIHKVFSRCSSLSKRKVPTLALFLSLPPSLRIFQFKIDSEIGFWNLLRPSLGLK